MTSSYKGLKEGLPRPGTRSLHVPCWNFARLSHQYLSLSNIQQNIHTWRASGRGAEVPEVRRNIPSTSLLFTMVINGGYKTSLIHGTVVRAARKK